MLVFAPFRASSGFKSRSWKQLRQRKSRSCRQEPVGENQGEEAPTSPSPAATEPGSRVAEHVRHGRKLEIKGEERARARCHPNLLPKVREGGGEITPRHTRWHIRRIRHRLEVHRAVGPMELLFSACPGYNKDGLQHRQAKLNNKTHQILTRCIFTRQFSVRRDPHKFLANGRRSGGCWEGSVRARTAGTAALENSKKQLFPFLGVFLSRRNPQRPVSAPGKRRDMPDPKPAATGYGVTQDLPVTQGVPMGWALGGDMSPVPSSVTPW